MFKRSAFCLPQRVNPAIETRGSREEIEQRGRELIPLTLVSSHLTIDQGTDGTRYGGELMFMIRRHAGRSRVRRQETNLLGQASLATDSTAWQQRRAPVSIP
ncbi:hypothetical protein AAHA92_25014 [Salvia divinorum]|uniref:Uncharacterized protein n=1 Tax=Salvia divinorum TaxID=28513 RepID=A0ABD1G9D2_SALDI